MSIPQLSFEVVENRGPSLVSQDAEGSASGMASWQEGLKACPFEKASFAPVANRVAGSPGIDRYIISPIQFVSGVGRTWLVI